MPLLLAAFALAARLHRVDAAFAAPTVPGYDWAKHPNTLLLIYPTADCGCGPAPAERVQEGLKRGHDVLVVAAKPSKELNALKTQFFPRARFALVTNLDSAIIKRFSPEDKVATVWIENGRIARRSEG